MKYIFLLILTTVAAMPVYAVEVTASSGLDVQMNWSKLKSLVDQASANISTVQADVDNVSKTAAGLQGRVVSAETSVSTLSSRVSACGSQGKVWNGSGCQAVASSSSGSSSCSMQSTQVSACGTVSGCPSGWSFASYVSGGPCGYNGEQALAQMVTTCIKTVCN